MKTGYITVFEKEADALNVLGHLKQSFPDSNNQLIKTAHQAQIWTKEADKAPKTTILGQLDDKPVYIVLSLPKE